MNAAALRSNLASDARELGFSWFGVAPASEAPHAGAFREWIGEGRHADMEWLARDPQRRADPGRVLENARSVLVLGMEYFQGNAPQTGWRIARYAWGEDYHDLIKERLLRLAEKLASHGGQQKVYVDTGPVLERDFAARAGIGWQGRSSMLIHPRAGCWFFLGVILTTLEFEANEPVPDHCGKCRRCVEACPTSAIREDRTLESARCISYLTIENKGPIPEEFRKEIGDRIYGCDECLDVCPWNRFAAVSREAAFAMPERVRNMRLRDFLAWDAETFRTVFRRSPIKRIKRERFLRNVCVALGNTGTEADLEALRVAAGDNSPLIAEHALWAISEIEQRAEPSV